MHSKSNLFIGLLCLMVMLSLPACSQAGQGEPELSAEERDQTAVAETAVVAQSVGTLVAATLDDACRLTLQAFEATLRAEPTPTATLEATITLTPNPDPPMVSVSEGTNCRTGPGIEFEIVGMLMVGEQAEVVGVSGNGEYWVIMLPPEASECWITGYYATVTGDTSDLPIRTPLSNTTPTSSPTSGPATGYNWTGTWTTSQGLPGAAHETLMVTLVQTNLTVTGSIEGGIDLSGTLSADGLTLTGTWSNPPHTGQFAFKLINMNQFIGNTHDYAYEWCGFRENAGVPSPCMGP